MGDGGKPWKKLLFHITSPTTFMMRCYSDWEGKGPCAIVPLTWKMAHKSLCRMIRNGPLKISKSLKKLKMAHLAKTSSQSLGVPSILGEIHVPQSIEKLFQPFLKYTVIWFNATLVWSYSLRMLIDQTINNILHTLCIMHMMYWPVSVSVSPPDLIKSTTCLCVAPSTLTLFLQKSKMFEIDIFRIKQKFQKSPHCQLLLSKINVKLKNTDIWTFSWQKEGVAT